MKICESVYPFLKGNLMFDSISKENLHHAYLLVGERAPLRVELLDFLTGLVGDITGNPDIEFVELDSMGVDEARDLTARAAQTPLGARRFFVLDVRSFTDQAQNALLKTLEDPRPGMHFFVLAEQESLFLDTLLSRFFILRHAGERGSVEMLALAEQFLMEGPVKRLEIAKPFMGKSDDPEERRRIRREGKEFLHTLARVLEQKIPKSERASKALRELALFEPYFTDAAFIPRLVLEHLAYTM